MTGSSLIPEVELFLDVREKNIFESHSTVLNKPIDLHLWLPVSTQFLTELSLRHLQLGSAEVTALGTFIQQGVLRCLQSVDISHNPSIGSEGAFTFSRSLIGNRRLKTLLWSGNNAFGAGVQWLSTLLVSTHIEHLDISHNNGGARGITAVAKRLRQATSIRRLELQENGFDREAFESLTLALAEASCCLSELVLSYRELCPDHVLLLHRKARFNVTIVSLEVVDAPPFVLDGVFDDVLQRNIAYRRRQICNYLEPSRPCVVADAETRVEPNVFEDFVRDELFEPQMLTLIKEFVLEDIVVSNANAAALAI